MKKLVLALAVAIMVFGSAKAAAPTATLTRDLACQVVNSALQNTEVRAVAAVFMGKVIEPRPDSTDDAAAGRSAVATFLRALADALES